MRQRFKTLTMAQLCEMRDNIDKTLFDTHNYHEGKFCPMGIALGCHLMENPTDEAVKARIAENYQPTNILKGVPGTFYHGDDASRRRDLLCLIDELLTELCGVEIPEPTTTEKPWFELARIIKTARARGLGPHPGGVRWVVELPMTEAEYRRFLELTK